MSRRAVSEQVVRAFFAAPSIRTSPLSSAASSSCSSIAPLERKELERLGRLAALDVRGRDAGFARSVAQVLEFCRSVGDAPVSAALLLQQQQLSSRGTNTKINRFPLVFESEVPFEPPSAEDGSEDVQVREGGQQRVLLQNASRAQEGFFVAPPVRALFSWLAMDPDVVLTNNKDDEDEWWSNMDEPTTERVRAINLSTSSPQVREGGQQHVLLQNASRAQEGFFVAPPVRALFS